MRNFDDLRPGLRALLTAACVVILMAGLRAAAPILVPLALAIFVSVVSLPVLNALRRARIPAALAVPMVVLLDVAALLGFGWLLARSVGDARTELPQYVLRLRELEASFLGWLAGRGMEVSALQTPDILEPERIFGILPLLFRSATDLMSMVFLVLLITAFMLAEASTLPNKLRRAMGHEESGLVRSHAIIGQVQQYLALKTLVSIATGTAVGVMTWVIGIDFALLWGMLAFLLNYIPNIGSVLAAVPAVLVGLLQHGPGTALLLIGLYLGVNVLFGNVVEPALIGRRLGLSTVVVLLSLLFWGWLWGPIGMFLSVPLTMAVKIVLENSPEFRWLAILMEAAPSQAAVEEEERPQIQL